MKLYLGKIGWGWRMYGFGDNGAKPALAVDE